MGKRGRPKKKEITIQSDETKNVIGILSLIASALLILSYSVDSPGFNIIRKYLGQSTIVGFVFFGNLALRMFRVDYPLSKTKSLIGQFLLILASSSFLHFFVDRNDALTFAEGGKFGGVVGYEITHSLLIDIFAKSGAFIIILLFTITAFSLAFSISIGDFLQLIGKGMRKFSDRVKQMDEKVKERKEQMKKEMEEQEGNEEIDLSGRMISDLQETEDQVQFQDKTNSPDDQTHEEESIESVKEDTPTASGKEDVEDEELEGALITSTLNYKNWKYPPVSLLSPPPKKEDTQENVKKNADIIEQTLQSFGVKTRVVDVVVGPTVTQYALNIALGTKVSRISNLKTDLALALAAPTGSVRIEAPIPGTSYIGIEIPNQNRETVVIKELIDSQEMKTHTKKLPVSVGKGISGKTIITDLMKMPHLLIAGATGSGKSVLMNSFLISLLMKLTPDEVRLIMVDPKQVELSDYNGIPHLLTPVITDMQKVLNALKWAIIEMEKRYTIFRQAHVRNIVGYNEKLGFAAMPFIVIVIDEMADLMLSCGAEVETSIVKLAQKARATGIHLLLATQRPSVDVLTGLIKANIPGRVGMGVATQIDSRVILDQVGAETLLGNGDMLFKEPDKAKPYRVQGVWVSPEEVNRVVKFIKTQAKEVHYENEVVERQADPGASPSVMQSAKFSEDEHFMDAVRIVCNAKKGSASLLQRKLSIGYNRAARLLDELQEMGVVGQQEGSKPRKILVSDPEEFMKQRQESMK